MEVEETERQRTEGQPDIGGTSPPSTDRSSNIGLTGGTMYRVRLTYLLTRGGSEKWVQPVGGID